MVAFFLSVTCDIPSRQERTALPSTCTGQAPHKPEPQPNFVPVSLRCSRTTQSNGVSGSASTLTGLPFTVNAIAAIPPSLGITVMICEVPAFLAQRPPARPDANQPSKIRKHAEAGQVECGQLNY